MTPEKKKQAKSAVKYRVTGGVTTPEKKKQAKSAVRYRVSERITAPESKKQAEFAVMYRVSAIAPAPKSSGDSLKLYSAAHGRQQIDQIQTQGDDGSYGLCLYVFF